MSGRHTGLCPEELSVIERDPKLPKTSLWVGTVKLSGSGTLTRVPKLDLVIQCSLLIASVWTVSSTRARIAEALPAMTCGQAQEEMKNEIISF